MFCLSNLSKGRHSLYAKTLSVRWLFSEKILGISDYEKQRLAIPKIDIDQTGLNTHLRSNNIDALITTTKQWIHIMDKRQCQMNFKLFVDCLQAINQNDSSSSSYSFGPPTMRMLSYFNLPDNAMQLYFDLKIGHMFTQLSTTVIMCDMLFNNGMYAEVLQVLQKSINRLKENGMRSSRLQNYLIFAACYKLNTEKHLEYALKIWNESVKEHQLTQSANFLRMLAINQNCPEIALNISEKINDHFSSMNVILLAHCELGNVNEAIQILESILQKNSRLSEHIIGKVVDLQKNATEQQMLSINSVLDELKLRKLTIRTTLDEMLCWQISVKLQKYLLEPKQKTTKNE